MNPNRGRLLFIVLAIGGAVAIVALLTMILTSTGTTTGGEDGGPIGISQSPVPSPSQGPTSSATPSSAGSTPRSPGGQAGWGAVTNVSKHSIVMELVSSEPVYVQIGWTAATATPQQGKFDGRPTHWSQTLAVYGAAPYAQFYTYFGFATAPVTCRITVDGKVWITQTATSAFGGLMCVA